MGQPPDEGLLDDEVHYLAGNLTLELRTGHDERPVRRVPLWQRDRLPLLGHGRPKVRPAWFLAAGCR